MASGAIVGRTPPTYISSVPHSQWGHHAFANMADITDAAAAAMDHDDVVVATPVDLDENRPTVPHPSDDQVPTCTMDLNDQWAYSVGDANTTSYLSGDQHIVDGFLKDLETRRPELCKNAKYVEFAVDSAATIMLGVLWLAAFLVLSTISKVVVRGFKGAGLSKATIVGTLSFHAIATHDERPEDVDGAYEFKVHLMPNLNSNLFSINAPIWEDRLRLSLMRPDEGTSMICRFDVGDNLILALPIRYSMVSRHWYIRGFVAIDPAEAMAASHEYAKYYETHGGVSAAQSINLCDNVCIATELHRLQLCEFKQLSLSPTEIFNICNARNISPCSDLDVPDARVHRCTICGTSFASGNLLHRHLRDAHGDVPPGPAEADGACMIHLEPGAPITPTPSLADSRRIASQMTTSQLLSVAADNRDDRGQSWPRWGCELDQSVTCCGGRVFASDIVNELWGCLGLLIWDDNQVVCVTSWADHGVRDAIMPMLVGSPEHELVRSGADMPTILDGLQGARIKLGTAGTAIPFEILRCIGQYERLDLDYGGESLKVPSLGRRLIQDIINITWGNTDRTQSDLDAIFLGGATLFPNQWRLEPPPALVGPCALNDCIATGASSTRAILRNWYFGCTFCPHRAPDRLAPTRLKFATMCMRQIARSSHKFPCAIGLMGPPGAGKHDYVANRHESGWTCGTEPVGFRDTDLGSEIQDIIAATAPPGNLSGCALGMAKHIVDSSPPPPAVNQCTIDSTHPWAALALLTSEYLHGDLTRDDFKEGCDHVTTCGWMPGTIVFISGDLAAIHKHVATRGRPGDRHITMHNLERTAGALMVVRDAMRACGDLTILEACRSTEVPDISADGDIDTLIFRHLQDSIRHRAGPVPATAASCNVPLATASTIDDATLCDLSSLGYRRAPNRPSYVNSTASDGASACTVQGADKAISKISKISTTNQPRYTKADGDDMGIDAANVDAIIQAASACATIRLRSDTKFLAQSSDHALEFCSNGTSTTRAPRATRDPGPCVHASDVCPGDMHHNGDPLAEDFYHRDASLKGIHSQLKGTLARTPTLRLHHEKGHKPWRGDCQVCLATMGVFKKTGAASMEPHSDARICHTFSADMITFNVRSHQGNKYLWGMRCGGGFLCGFPLARRSDLTDTFSKWIDKMRADSRYGHHDYAFCEALQIDGAGEQIAARGNWLSDNSRWNAMLRSKDPSPVARRFDPTHKESAGPAENVMRACELTIKGILLQGAMPAACWEDSWYQTELLHRLVPRRMDIVSAQGDAAVPWTRATAGRIDGAMCRYWYKCFINLGTVCMVKDYHKGSDLVEKKYRFGIVLGMVDDSPDLITFFCPFKGRSCLFRSKHYAIIHRELGLTYWEFLGLEAPRDSIKALGRVGDHRINSHSYVLEIDGIENWGTEAGLTTGEPNRSIQEVIGHRGVAAPKCFIVDKDGNHWSPDHDGKFAKVGPLLQRLNDAGIIPPPAPATPAPMDATAIEAVKLLKADPLSVIGTTFYKQFDQGLYKGRITKYTARTKYWHAMYDQECPLASEPDHDYELLSFNEIVTYVICHLDRPPGAEPPLDDVVPATNHPESSPEPEPEPSTMDVINPYMIQPGERAPIWPTAVVRGQPHITTADGDTFEKVISNLTLLGDARPAEYLEFLGAAYGAKAPNSDPMPDTLGIEFHHPLTHRGGLKRHGHTPLPAGVIFPEPRGPRWEHILRRRAAIVDQAACSASYDQLLEAGHRLASAYTASNRSTRANDEASSFGVYRSICPKSRKPPGFGEQVAKMCAGIDPEAQRILPQLAEAICPGVNSTAGLDPIVAAAKLCATLGAEPARDFVNRAAAVSVRTVIREWPDWDLSDYTVDGRVTAPSTVAEAMARPDWPRWEDSIAVEYGSIDDMGVLIHNVTRRTARLKYNITHKAVPLGIDFKVSYDTNSRIKKYKTRRLVRGHPGAVTKNVHYGETWAPSPNVVTNRIIQVLGLMSGAYRLATDIAVAFLHAKLKPEEYVLCEYEAHQQPDRMAPDGEKYYAVLVRGLYGLPSSSNLFSNLFRGWMCTEFNSNGWKCDPSAHDPCLFILRSPDSSTGRATSGVTGAPTVAPTIPPDTAQVADDQAVHPDRHRSGSLNLDPHIIYLVAHVDDCDMVGGNLDDLTYIRDAMDEKFGVKDCDPAEMLGVRREISADGSTLTLSMTGFIEHLHAKFDQHCGKRARNVPFPAGEMLTRLDSIPAESARVTERGLRELAGGLLWLWRMCMIELGPGINQVCKMMSAPTERTWDLAIQLLEYAYQHRDLGVRFHRDGNLVPTTFYDSGGKVDPADSRAQHGHAVMMGNGPIGWLCRKHKHVASAGTMGKEWMALAWGVKETVAIRMLLREMGALAPDARPSPVIGDNKETVNFAVHNKMTKNMRHIPECYHLTREWFMAGEIAPLWIEGDSNPSDLLSKPVSKQVLVRLRGTLAGYDDPLADYPKPERGTQRPVPGRTPDFSKFDDLGPRFNTQ